jgi:hypothetical protein
MSHVVVMNVRIFEGGRLLTGDWGRAIVCVSKLQG